MATTESAMYENICPAGSFCSLWDAANPEDANGHKYFDPPKGLDRYPDTVAPTDGGSGCPASFWCPKGTDRLIRIPVGTVFGERGDSTPGTYTLAGLGDATTLELSPEGYIDEAGYTDGMEYCPEGHWCYEGGDSAIKCGPGYYRFDKYGRTQADCAKCPAGYYCDNEATGHF